MNIRNNKLYIKELLPLAKEAHMRITNLPEYQQELIKLISPKITLGHHLHVWCKICRWRGAMEDECEELALYETEPENSANVVNREKSSFFGFFLMFTCLIIFMVIIATLGTAK